jgi:hypothetical protein
MAYTTHEKIRSFAGFQQVFVKEAFVNSPDGSAKTFYVKSDDVYKFVPNFYTGSTVAGVSDVAVWVGLSGVLGSSRVNITSINSDEGSVTLSGTPDNGCSLTVTYASSPLSGDAIENVRLQAESIINQKLSNCYDLPISPTPSVLESLATRLSSAMLLIRGYGTGARDTNGDGYALYSQLMGTNSIMGDNESSTIEVGEIGMICQPNYQLVDDTGAVIPRNDENTIDGGSDYVAGGRVVGRLYDVTEEEFRFKEYQVDADRDQKGSARNV